MGPIRRTINFLIALSMSSAGVVITAYLIFFADDWRGWMLMGSGVMAFAGLYWLWADFIEPGSRPEC